MQTRLLTPFLAGLLLAPIACGDDKGGSTGSETDVSSTGTPPPTTGDTVPTTTEEPDPSTTEEPTPTTTDDPPPTTTGDDPTTGEPVDCAAPADGADEDMDGVANMADNCRCDANPNQLDYDGNSVGNVCDAPLQVQDRRRRAARVQQARHHGHAPRWPCRCSFPVSLIVLNGDLQVTLDDVGSAKLFAPSSTSPTPRS
jgi:hypothetical protein